MMFSAGICIASSRRQLEWEVTWPQTSLKCCWIIGDVIPCCLFLQNAIRLFLQNACAQWFCPCFILSSCATNDGQTWLLAEIVLIWGWCDHYIMTFHSLQYHVLNATCIANSVNARLLVNVKFCAPLRGLTFVRQYIFPWFLHDGNLWFI